METKSIIITIISFDLCISESNNTLNLYFYKGKEITKNKESEFSFVMNTQLFFFLGTQLLIFSYKYAKLGKYNKLIQN